MQSLLCVLSSTGSLPSTGTAAHQHSFEPSHWNDTPHLAQIRVLGKQIVSDAV